MEEQKSLAKMGTKPVGSLMLSLGVPMIISMVLQALYNIVDSAFVSNMSEGGEMVTLAFPVQMLMVAVSVGTGVGVNALLSKNLGMGNKKKANYVSGNAIFLGLIIYALCLLFGLFGVNTYISTQTSNHEIYEMAVDYLRICSVMSMGTVFFAIFEKTLQATGLSIYSTIAMITGAVMNIILDPIFIYGLFGLPAMGVKGAAYATIIGQIASGALGFIFHIKYNKAVKTGIKYLKPSGRIIREIYAIGFPAIIAQALMSVMTYGFNIILVRVDEAMVTAYGLYYKIQQFILFAAFGLRDAITPIVSFNYGMKSKSRVKDGVKYGIIYTFIIMVIGIILLECCASPLSKIFGLSGTTQDLCVSAMRIISTSFIFAGLNVAFQGIFQALEGGIESFVISICRQLIFVLPVAWGFSLLAMQSMDNAWLVWLTFPIAEFISAVIACIFMRKIYKKKINVLN
jgi:multidrug efflux pump